MLLAVIAVYIVLLSGVFKLIFPFILLFIQYNSILKVCQSRINYCNFFFNLIVNCQHCIFYSKVQLTTDNDFNHLNDNILICYIFINIKCFLPHLTACKVYYLLTDTRTCFRLSPSYVCHTQFFFDCFEHANVLSHCQIFFRIVLDKNNKLVMFL